MNPNKVYGYFQLIIVAVYIALGFALLTVPALKDKLGDFQRIGLAVILLLYAGYRGYIIYSKYFSARNNERE